MNEHDHTVLKITYYKLTFLCIFKICIGITRQYGHYERFVPLFFVMKTYLMRLKEVILLQFCMWKNICGMQ